MTWQGSIFNEKSFAHAKAGVVAIFLDGVAGVSPDRGHVQVPRAEAERLIKRAKKTYAELVMQTPPRAEALRHASQLRELRRLIHAADQIIAGKRAQRMTEADYAANRRALEAR